MLAGYGIVAVVVVVPFLLLLPLATGDDYIEPEDANTAGTYAVNSTFEANLDSLAAALIANASATPAGFATGTAGTAPDKVFAMALCRGDTNASSCGACARAAFVAGKQSNPGNKGVAVYKDACTIRYSGRQQFMNFIRQEQWQVSQIIWNIQRAATSVSGPAAGWFNASVTKILTALVEQAADAAGNSTTKKYFATGEEDFVPKIYGLAQCLPDLVKEQCHECLKSLHNSANLYMRDSLPKWIVTRSLWCSLWYSVRKFYDGRSMLQLSAPPPPPPADTPVVTKPGEEKKKNTTAGLSVGLASSVVVLLILSVFAFIRFKRRTKTVEIEHPLRKITRAQCTIFDLPTLQEATEDFSMNNKLGEGGFGTVYKGVLSDGQEIAVKKLLGRAGHGLDQLHNEVLLLAELQHKNLVRLQGFCLHREETLLVYEYIKNGSLDNLLFDTSSGNALNWKQHYNIILGIAKGIVYLHEDSALRIIHRDLKANNILLDEDMDPKIADFGLARLLGEGHTQTRTARVVGTFGYMPPEYLARGSVSTKIDIFSFGVLVLEIVTRRSNCRPEDHDSVNLLSDVWNCWTKGTVSQMIDQSLDEYSQSQARRCIHIGLLCVQPDPDDRPHISSVIFMLTRENMDLQQPSQPAFYFGRESAPSSPSWGQRSYVYDRSGVPGVSANGVTLTEIYPR